MPNMKFVLLTMLLLSQMAGASARSLSPYEQMNSCYPSSPMLMSDMCNGQVFMGGLPSATNYNGLQNNQFADLYMLMNSLQGNNMMSADPLAGLNLSNSMLWQQQQPSMFPQDMMGLSPLSAVK